MERLSEKKRGFFKWRRFGFKNAEETDKLDARGGDVVEDAAAAAAGFGGHTPVDIKAKLVKRRTPNKTWRKSMS